MVSTAATAATASATAGSLACTASGGRAPDVGFMRRAHARERHVKLSMPLTLKMFVCVLTRGDDEEIMLELSDLRSKEAEIEAQPRVDEA